MAGLVEELQADALNESVHVMALLRKAKAVSVKLNAPSISDWIENEVQGYNSNDEIPPYRHVRGNLVCFNPIRGHIPLGMNDRAQLEKLTFRKIALPLGKLCEYAAADNTIVLGFSAKQAENLMNGMTYRMEPGLEIEASTLKNIIYSVKDKIMQFALELESQGILGEGMGFSKEEKAAAASVTYNSISIGNMHNSQIQQNSDNSNQYYESQKFKEDLEKFVSEVRDQLDKLNANDEAKQSLRADLDTIKAQLSSSSPKKMILRECLLSAKNILEGAAGGVLTNYIPVATQLIAACS